jgi:hypothetical protein
MDRSPGWVGRWYILWECLHHISLKSCNFSKQKTIRAEGRNCDGVQIFSPTVPIGVRSELHFSHQLIHGRTKPNYAEISMVECPWLQKGPDTPGRESHRKQCDWDTTRQTDLTAVAIKRSNIFLQSHHPLRKGARPLGARNFCSHASA